MDSDDGPNQQKNFNSFLQPSIEGMKTLQGEIECYDVLNVELFQLKARILAWTGDIPAVTKIMCFTGHNSYQGCRFYHEAILKNIDEINDCVKEKSILFELKSIKFPKSFPLDIIMHLFFENVGPNMCKFWSGNFYKNNINLEEDYLISKKDLQEIGNILYNNKYNIPSNGRIPRNIYKHSAGYKAEEWSKWILYFSLPLMKTAKLCTELQLEVDEPNLIKENLENFCLHYIDKYNEDGD
ncbi:8935_t:CDS:2 [Entrophospora sp. SA101]|nr:8935_t:CDS:2 [Entrophospora sp. SA101]